MRKFALALLVLALFSSFSYATYTVVLQGEYPEAKAPLLHFIPMPDGTKLSIGDNWASYGGHYGDYTVKLTNTGKNITLELYGTDESRENLDSELAWMAGVAKIDGDTCRSFSITDNPDGSHEICGYAVDVYEPLPAAGTGAMPPAISVPGASTDSPPSPPDGSGADMPPSPPQDFTTERVYGGGMVEQAYSAVGSAIDSLYASAGIGGTVAGAAEETAGAAPPQDGGATAGRIGAALICPMLVAVLLIIIASFLLISIRHDPAIAPQSDPEIERLLSNETRAGILEELSQADKIPTHLSNKLGVSKPAITNHLADLMEAGLVEKVGAEGKKFVYYRLTQKGRQILLARAG